MHCAHFLQAQYANLLGENYVINSPALEFAAWA